MTAELDFDRIVAAWLADDGPQDLATGALDVALVSAREVGQRRGWRMLAMGPTPWPESAEVVRARAARRGVRLLLVALLLVAVVGASLLIGARLVRPSPIHVVGIFEPTGSMRAARYWAQATTLADGRVLVTGETGPNPGLPDGVTAELYDPASATFHPAGPMHVDGAPAGTSVQVRLADGRVLVLGGIGGRGPVPYQPFARIYDPVSNTFEITTPWPDDAGLADRHVGTLLEDGRVRFEGAAPGDVEVEFDPGAGAYRIIDRVIPSIPDGLRASATRLLDGRILIVGVDDNASRDYVAIFDPTIGQSTMLDTPDLNAGDAPKGFVLPDGRVLLLGGTSGVFGKSGVFDVRSRSFEALAIRRAKLLLWLDDGRALLDGVGPDDSGSDGHRLAFYDSVTATLEFAKTKAPDDCCAAWTTLADGRVLGVGGMLESVPSRNAYIVH